MSKLSKFIIVLALAFILISNFSYIYAATPNMNLGNTTTSGNTTTTTTTTSSSVTASNFDLELTNILCIVLIVVGVLLILLGFAILLRLKG